MRTRGEDVGGKDLFEIFIGVEEKFAGKEGRRSFYNFLAINLLYANDDATHLFPGTC